MKYEKLTDEEIQDITEKVKRFLAEKKQAYESYSKSNSDIDHVNKFYAKSIYRLLHHSSQDPFDLADQARTIIQSRIKEWLDDQDIKVVINKLVLDAVKTIQSWDTTMLLAAIFINKNEIMPEPLHNLVIRHLSGEDSRPTTGSISSRYVRDTLLSSAVHMLIDDHHPFREMIDLKDIKIRAYSEKWPEQSAYVIVANAANELGWKIRNKDIKTHNVKDSVSAKIDHLPII
ncbi:MAG: hypothetical protein OQK69_12155 [Gammaproteobacteria bacterium]|nr:hypothetical protein [Gammaproteobacteria bacterium]